MIRRFIESHFSIVLLFSVGVGLVAPIGGIPDDAASVALAMLTYASCFKLRDGGYADIRWKDVARFYLARYIILPVVMFGVAHIVIPEYALGVFLLALVPAAVSSPAFAHMFGGSVPPAFAITITSTCLAPFLIPLQFSWASDVAMNISPLGMFRTLSFCIFLPMALYFISKSISGLPYLSEQGEAQLAKGLGVSPPFKEKSYTLCSMLRKYALKWEGYMYDNVKLISIVLVAFVIALVIAKQRELILADIPALMLLLVASIICFALFLWVGYWLGRQCSRETRTTYIVCSGFNNVALGVSLALVHFPPAIILLVAVSEAAWAVLPVMIKRLLRL